MLKMKLKGKNNLLQVELPMLTLGLLLSSMRPLSRICRLAYTSKRTYTFFIPHWDSTCAATSQPSCANHETPSSEVTLWVGLVWPVDLPNTGTDAPHTSSLAHVFTGPNGDHVK